MSKYIAMTNSGILFDYLDTKLDMISLEDIAHSLTKICRYGGALPLRTHYSVAQHCLELVAFADSKHMHIDVKLALLFHDASEAYLGDIPSGLKGLLPDYKKLESRVQTIICTKFDIPSSPKIRSIVHEFDKNIILDETKGIWGERYSEFELVALRLNKDIRPLGVEISVRPLGAMQRVKTKWLSTATKLLTQWAAHKEYRANREIQNEE
jgi:5'-deoxynucleotidase YfbR-like HD superfamily hydrolase